MTEAERLLSMAGGGFLALWALRRGGLFAAIAAVAGGGLLYASQRRRWPNFEALTAPATGSRPDLGQRAERQLGRQGQGQSDMQEQDDSVSMRRSVVIQRDKDEVYRFWRDLTNLGRFMEHIERVEVIDDKRSRWIVHAPVGQKVQWEAIITEDKPGERIAWTSAEGADIRNEGWVTFTSEGDNRTRVEACMTFDPPNGPMGGILSQIFGEQATIQAEDDLQRMKEVIEGDGSRGQRDKGNSMPRTARN